MNFVLGAQRRMDISSAGWIFLPSDGYFFRRMDGADQLWHQWLILRVYGYSCELMLLIRLQQNVKKFIGVYKNKPKLCKHCTFRLERLKYCMYLLTNENT